MILVNQKHSYSGKNVRMEQLIYGRVMPRFKFTRTVTKPYDINITHTKRFKNTNLDGYRKLSQKTRKPKKNIPITTPMRTYETFSLRTRVSIKTLTFLSNTHSVLGENIIGVMCLHYTAPIYANNVIVVRKSKNTTVNIIIPRHVPTFFLPFTFEEYQLLHETNYVYSESILLQLLLAVVFYCKLYSMLNAKYWIKSNNIVQDYLNTDALCIIEIPAL